MKLYYVINRETGAAALPHGYLNARDAKLAMKCHNHRTSWRKYAVASVDATPVIESIVNERGEWEAPTNG